MNRMYLHYFSVLFLIPSIMGHGNMIRPRTWWNPEGWDGNHVGCGVLDLPDTEFEHHNSHASAPDCMDYWFSNHVEIPGHATLPDHVSQPEVKCIGQLVIMMMITNFLGGPLEQLKFLVPVELWVEFLQVVMETTQVSLVTAALIIVMHLLLEKMLRSMIGVVMMFQSQLGLLDLWLKSSGMLVQTMQVATHIVSARYHTMESTMVT